MTKRVALVTGAVGEMGHLLLPSLQNQGYETVALDLAALPKALAAGCVEVVQASVLDAPAIEKLLLKHRPELVLHLAAVLSTKAERDPDLAHDVNVGGTLLLLRLLRDQARSTGQSVRFLFPSSIAVYGLPDRATKESAGTIREEDWTRPSGMYGINKLQCEMLGTYFCARALREGSAGIDFRAIRFPGLISAATLPTGGTTDYAPEMLHAAAQGKPYACFVDAATRLPFMTMSDAVAAFLRLAEAPAASLSTRVYNVRSFSASAEEIQRAIQSYYEDARVSYEPQASRQAIVDSWPTDIDDARARRDWGFSPKLDLEAALREELVPALRRRYAARASR